MAAKQPDDYERPIVGTFVDVVDGPYKGFYGAYIKPEDKGLALLRNRDHHDDFEEFITTKFEYLRNTKRVGSH